MSGQKKFTDVLDIKGYPYRLENGWVIVDYGGYVVLRSLTTLPEKVKFENGRNVYLPSLTTLPENVKFENGGSVSLPSLTTLPENVKFENGWSVYLPSLTTLPENVKFENGGGAYLDNLTTLPENVKFENGGSVSLPSLTTLPENVKFENGRNVHLYSLTTLPENVKFENGGSVSLSSLTDERRPYRGQTIRLKNVDGYTMLIGSERQLGNITLYRARYFGGGDLDQLKVCYVAHEGDYYAHGDDAKQAMRDLRFKIMQADFDPEELVAEVKARGTVTFNDYRLLTGACESGLTHGLAQLGAEGAEEMPLTDALNLCRGNYGGDEFIKLFEEAAA